MPRAPQSDEPCHRSLEREFFAAVPPRPAPWPRRAAWWALVIVLRWPLVRALLLRR